MTPKEFAAKAEKMLADAPRHLFYETRMAIIASARREFPENSTVQEIDDALPSNPPKLSPLRTVKTAHDRFLKA